MTQPACTVAGYLVMRLQEIGVGHLFSIPGDSISPFLREIEKSTIYRIGNTDEINAGYAADGYARLNGIGAVAVPYGVGSLSLLNTIAGAFVEKVPVIVINGAPGAARHLQERHGGNLWRHAIIPRSNDLEIYRQVTVAAEQISNPALAPRQIDRALMACLTERRPVYLEICEDLYDLPCELPQEKMDGACSVQSDSLSLQAAVDTAARKIRGARRPVIWGGIEIQRHGLQDPFETLVNQTTIPFTTSLLGKSIISEANQFFVGVFDGKSSDARTWDIVTRSDCLIGLGVWATDTSLLGVIGNEQEDALLWGEHVILAAHDSVRIGRAYYARVALPDFIACLAETLRDTPLGPFGRPDRPGYQPPAPPDARLTFDNFFHRMEGFVDDSMVVVSDIGFSVLSAMNLRIKQRSGFIAQAAWASIGYSVGAVMGVKYAMPDKRPVVFVGDGAFHTGCQAISTMVEQGLNPVIFVMNNGLYGIEQWSMDPSVFATGDSSRIAPPHILKRWNYSRLTEVFGGLGWTVRSVAELDQALVQIREQREALALVDVQLQPLSYPANAAWRVHDGTYRHPPRSPHIER